MHGSKKTTPNKASKKIIEKEIYSNLQDNRQKQTPKIKLGQLLRTAVIKKVFTKGDSRNYSY